MSKFEFEKYPALAECMQEYASFGRFDNWQKFTNALEKALKEAKKIDGNEIEARYKNWCKETNRNGGVLIGKSIHEFIEYLSLHR